MTSGRKTSYLLVLWMFLSQGRPQLLNLDVPQKVMEFQHLQSPNPHSFAVLEGSIGVDLKAFTLCYRIKPYFFRPEVIVISYVMNKNDILRTDHNRRGLQLMLPLQRVRQATAAVTPLMYWSGWCYAMDSATGEWKIFMNGELVQEGTWLPVSKVVLPANGTLVLGQDQDEAIGGFDATQSFCGEFTDLQIYSKMLDGFDMKDITTCESLMVGDVLSWKDAKFAMNGDSRESVTTLMATCEVRPVPFFMFLDKLQFRESTALCSSFGGELATPMNADEQETLFRLSSVNADICAADGGALMWLGIQDENEEKIWRYYNSHEEVQFLLWAQGQPSGGELENCAVMKGGTFSGTWADNGCHKSFKFCPVCRVRIPVFLRLRGICDSNLYDDRFILAGLRNQKPYFRGYYRSHVFHDGLGWRLENILENNTFAVMEESGSVDYPIGRNNWRFSHGFCGRKSGELISMALTQCQNNVKFTCNDGNCIDIDQVCDRRPQCNDNSDELDCSIVLKPEGYQPELPPPSLNNSGPLPVFLNLTLESFKSVEPIRNHFTVDVVVKMIWKDIRLHFKNLREDRQLNIVLPEDAKEIWVPVVDFLNAEGNQNSEVDLHSKVTIKRLGGKVEDNVELSKEASIYNGYENYLRISRKYTITFSCNFNFFYYPFNTNYCSMIFQVKRNTDAYVALLKYGDGINYDHNDRLSEYDIGRILVKKLSTREPYSGLEVVIQMKHLYASQILTIFIPSTIINLITYTTFFFKWYDFTNRVMVSLTSLLVLMTLFSQVADTLPKTSYFKLVDIWFFVSILYTFIIILVHTIVESFHKYDMEIKEEEERRREVEKKMLGVAPPRSAFSEIASTASYFSDDSDFSDSDYDTESDDDPSGTTLSHNYVPVLIDKWGNLITTAIYIVLNVIFWAMAFTEKIQENIKDYEYEMMLQKQPVQEVRGYP